MVRGLEVAQGVGDCLGGDGDCLGGLRLLGRLEVASEIGNCLGGRRLVTRLEIAFEVVDWLGDFLGLRRWFRRLDLSCL